MKKALKQLYRYYQAPPSPDLTLYLSTLKTPKAYTQDTFIVGIQAFTQIANLSPEERFAFFGSQFSGLHYNNDLAKLWNNQSSEEINALELSSLCPTDWDWTVQNSLQLYIYKGNTPSIALDTFLQGPTVIDCGIFCQLSIWFGIRHMLGDEKFNQVFGKGPFYLTQLNYNAIEQSTKPELGNPLFPFFSNTAVIGENKVGIDYFKNTDAYPIKHPGSTSNGQNTINIDGIFTIFAPLLTTKFNLKKEDIARLLRDSFNAPQNIYDQYRLDLYKTKDPDSIYNALGITYGNLISMAELLAHQQSDEYHKTSASPVRQICFDFKTFINWVEKVSQPLRVDYVPLTTSELNIPATLINQIPFENRETMSFPSFNRETPLQDDMYSLSTKFCHDVMSGQSSAVVLTGDAGIGKTASAVSCAYELASRNKEVLWISEVILSGWTAKATTMDEYTTLRDSIIPLLSDNLDVVFLDDNNLVGDVGLSLFEAVYDWFANHPGKGVFITSNEKNPLNLCYGFKLDQTYHCPPFLGYFSNAYRNTVIQSGLRGTTLRASNTLDITSFTSSDKITTLKNCRARQSVGIIIDKATFEQAKDLLGCMEFVPGIEDLYAIHQEIIETGEVGQHYEQLTADQKRWTQRDAVTKFIFDSNGRGIDTDEFDYMDIYIRNFESTPHKIIAVEVLQYHNEALKRDEINWNCFNQLLTVIHYAHDHGEKKIIIINCTLFSDEQLIEKFAEQLNKREQERTMARLKLLLFSPALLQTGREEEIEEVAVTRERTSSAREYPRFFTVPILALTYPQRLALTWKQEDTVAFKKT